MDNGLFGLLRQHAKEARIGGVLGSLSSGSLLFVTGGNWQHFIGEWIVRLFFALLAGAISAIGTAWGKDAYENYKQERKRKNIEYEQRKKDRAA